MGFTLRDNNLIAIAGLANSGKTEASKMLEYILNAPKPFRTYFWYKIFKKWNGKWETTAFAKPLKQTLAIILNKPLEWFENRSNKEKYVNIDTLKIYNVSDVPYQLSENRFTKLIKTGEPLPEETRYISIRQLMQYYGTEVIRKYLGDKTWINATLNQCNKKNIIVSDLRFNVEYNEVIDRGGLVIYITRKGCTPGSHSSEREVIEMEDRFNIIVENNGSLKELFDSLNWLSEH